MERHHVAPRGSAALAQRTIVPDTSEVQRRSSADQKHMWTSWKRAPLTIVGTLMATRVSLKIGVVSPGSRIPQKCAPTGHNWVNERLNTSQQTPCGASGGTPCPSTKKNSDPKW